MVEKKTLFPETTNDIGGTLVFASVLLAGLFFMSKSGTRPVDPFLMYLTTTLLLIVLFVRTAKFGSYTEALGLESPFPGYNILMAISGVGVSAILYSSFIRPLTMTFMGDKFMMAIIRPFYLPQITLPFAITLSYGGTVGNIIFWTMVGAAETFMVILIFKNISGWLYDRGWSKLFSFFIAFTASGVFFGLFHMFAWPVLNIFSVLVAVIFNYIFFSTYFFADFVGILTPKELTNMSTILATGAIGAHTGIDYFLSNGSPLPPDQTFIFGLISFAVPMVVMLYIRKKH